MTLHSDWERMGIATLAAGILLCATFSRGEGAAPRDPRRDMITALPASGPHPSLGGEARLFDRMVGTWDCDYSFHAEDGSVSHSAGELRFGWIIDGRALQDIWITYPKSPNGERSIGTTLRFFDTSSKIWRVVFVAPAFNMVITMQGGAGGERIVLRGQDSDGSLLRWAFSDIQADSFVWRGESPALRHQRLQDAADPRPCHPLGAETDP